MKNLKINKKLFISFGVVVLMLIACVVVSIFNLQDVQTQVESFYNGPYVVRAAASGMRADFEAMVKSVFRSMSSENEQVVQESLNDVETAKNNLQSQMAVVAEKFAGDKQLVTDLQSYLTELAPHREAVLEMAKQNKNAEAAEYMENNNIPIIEKASAKLDEIIGLVNDRGDELIKTINDVQASSILILIILGVISVIISVTFALYISKSITGPVNEIKAAAEKLSRGSLDAVINYKSKDELGNLAESMRLTVSTLKTYIEDISRGMAEMEKGNLDIAPSADFQGEFIALRDSIVNVISSFNSTLKQINQSADQVSSGAGQVSTGAQALAQGATEQASSVQQLASSINLISEQVRNNADNANQARLKAENVGGEIMTSNEQMQAMIKAMAEISNSSNEIGKIIKTIEDIAFQTNILALNAAVEAARAGEAGKGFAVVADEVRNLASKSAEAAKDTTALIESSIQAVENGTKIADETAQSLNTVVEGAKLVVDTVNKISHASDEQAQSIQQVTQGVDQISSVVQTNSATAEESAAASEELSGQAAMLKELVGKFKLKDDDSRQSLSFSSAIPDYTESKTIDMSGSKY